MRRFLVIILVIVLLVSVVLVGLIIRVTRTNAAEAALLNDGLRGPVARVRVENAPYVNRFGEWLEAARSLESDTRYDQQGRVLEMSRYTPDNKLDYRFSYSYDGDKLVEEASYDADGRPLYLWRHSYNEQRRDLSGYDSDGKLDFKLVSYFDEQDRLDREISYAADERINYEASYSYSRKGMTRTTQYYSLGDEADYRVVETFDGAGNRLEEAAFELDALQYRVIYKYNEAGRLLEEIASDAFGNSEYKLVNRYDARGNLLESSEYDSAGELFYRYEYAYDAFDNVIKRSSLSASGETTFSFEYDYEMDERGNWIKRVTSQWQTRFGEEVLEPVSVSYRDISYY